MKSFLLNYIAGILIACLILSPCAYSQYPELSFDHLLPGKDENSNTILKIHQDKQGFLWFGTKMGMIRYDGYQFIQYRYAINKPDGISGDFIRDFAEDENGDLWIAVENGGLNWYQREYNRFRSFHHHPDDSTGLSTNDVMSVLPDEDGTVWVGTKKGFFHFDPPTGRFQLIRLTGEPLRVFVMRIIKDHQGILWLATRNNGLISFDPKNELVKMFTHNPDVPESISSDRLWTVYEDSRHDIWIGSLGGGLNRYEKKSGRFTRYRYDSRNNTSISSDDIMAIYEDRQQRLWIGTHNNGLNLFHPQDETFFRYVYDENNPKGILSPVVLSFFQDASGSFWVGTYGTGVNVMMNSWKKIHFQDQMISGKNTIPIRAVLSAIQCKDGTVWMGNHLGLSVYDTKTRTARLFASERYANPEIAKYALYTLFETKDTLLWMGTELGLGKMDRKKKRFDLFQCPYVTQQAIETIHEIPDGRLWVNFSEQASFLFNPNSKVFSRLGDESSQIRLLQGVRILNFYPEGDSVLWIGTNRDGLYKYGFRDDRLVSFKVTPNDSHGISNNVILCIRPGKNETLWIGTEGGLNLLDKKTGRFRVYREEDGLTNAIVYGVFYDTKGFAWIVSSAAVSRFDPSSGSFRNYDPGDGFPDGHFQYKAIVLLTDGSALIGHQSGLVRFHPDDINDNPYPPPVVLTGFRKLNRDYHFDKNITVIREMKLSYKDYLIAFEFAALNFIHPEKNRYAYMIEGFDENWNYTNKERTAVYTNLSPGTYTFRVKASNHDGVWNEEGLSVRIIIEPPFWKTWWAYAFYGLISAGLLFAGFQWRSRSIRRRNRELERKVDERTRELKETQAQLIQTGKMASLGEMVAGLSHEINNPVTFITGNIENIRNDLKILLKSDSEPDIKVLLSEIDNALQSSLYGARRIRDIVQNMKNFSKLDESEFKDVRIHNEIDTILDLFFNQLKDIRFDRQYDPKLNEQTIPCYAAQINQCLRNILINAVQAIREAEKKNILPAGTGFVTIATMLQDHQVQLTFSDNGIGIQEEIIDKVFDPFFTTRDVGAGKGLGLTESYGIIQKHGGKITLNSRYEKGTEVRILIPVENSLLSEIK